MILSYNYWLRQFNKKLSQGFIIISGMAVGVFVTYVFLLLVGDVSIDNLIVYFPGILSGGGTGFWAYLLIQKEYAKPVKTLTNCINQAFDDIHVDLSSEHLLKCWEVTNCNQTQCPHYLAGEDLRCWESKSEEHCSNVCADCQVFLAVRSSDVGSLIEGVNSYFYHLRDFLGQLIPLVKNLEENNLLINSQSNLFSKSGEAVSNRIDKITDAVQTQVSTTQEAVSVIITQGGSLNKLVDAANNMTTVISNTASSIDQITRIIDSVATRVNEVDEISEQATEEAREGGKAVVDAMCGMEVILGKMDKLNEVLNDLGVSSKEIGNIIDTINQISDQTNLLALNAAIEAARAGEHGRGFAVVAEEVRKLAIRSSQATNVISEMIQAIQQKVEDTVEVASSGIEEVRTGATLVNTAGDTLEKIITAVRTTSNLMDEIAKGTREQRAGSEDLKKGMIALKKISAHSEKVVKNQQSENTIVVKAVEDMAEGAENIAHQAVNISIYLAEQENSTEEISALLAKQLEDMKKINEKLNCLFGETTPSSPLSPPPAEPALTDQSAAEPSDELVSEKQIVPVED